MRRIETFPWWDELVGLKDRYSLRELADRFDVTPGAITAAFKRTNTSRKAAPPGPRSRRQAIPADDALPPEPGEKAGASRPGSKDGKIARHADLLGKVPDAQVARAAGVSVRTVAAYRARHGVAGYAGPRRRGADKQPRKSRIDAFSDLVGTVPDRVVAEKAGVSVNAVRNWRVKRKVAAQGRRAARAAAPSTIASGAPSAALPAPAPAPAPAAPRTAAGSAWRVVAGGSDRVVRVVVAATLAEAAARAEAAGLGRVVALEWIGEVL